MHAALTIRKGDTVTAIHDSSLAQQWIASLMVSEAPTLDDVAQRLTVIEAALRAKVATGVSHLQQLKTAPAADGPPGEARPAVKRPRRRRNRAPRNLDRPLAATSAAADLGDQDTADGSM